jgi:hypothetical protein
MNRLMTRTVVFPSKTLSSSGADDGIRTRDLRFTKPLLYQLSYVGAREREDRIRN